MSGYRFWVRGGVGAQLLNLNRVLASWNSSLQPLVGFITHRLLLITASRRLQARFPPFSRTQSLWEERGLINLVPMAFSLPTKGEGLGNEVGGSSPEQRLAI